MFSVHETARFASAVLSHSTIIVFQCIQPLAAEDGELPCFTIGHVVGSHGLAGSLG
jgi:hypothetical protein